MSKLSQSLHLRRPRTTDRFNNIHKQKCSSASKSSNITGRINHHIYKGTNKKLSRSPTRNLSSNNKNRIKNQSQSKYTTKKKDLILS